MKKILMIAALAATVCMARAQLTMQQALEAVEAHNSSLKAIYEGLEAQKLQNRTGLNLPNPEVEFAYLWGSPDGIPNRKDVSVSQSFDMATLLGYKRRVALQENQLLELQYRKERMNLLLEAKETLVNLVYYNALWQQAHLRLQAAMQLDSAYQKKFNAGEAGVIETGKIHLSIALLTAQIEQVQVERAALLGKLQQLAGGTPLSFEATEYEEQGVLPSQFDEWYAAASQHSPLLAYVQHDVEASRARVALSRAQGLPSLKAGYTSELIKDDNYHGVSVGLTIPLWENKNRVKQARAAALAAESRMEDARITFYTSLLTQYNRVQGLQASAARLTEALGGAHTMTLLTKALEGGKLSLLDYLQESDFYYQAAGSALEAQRDYQLALARLQAVEL